MQQIRSKREQFVREIRSKQRNEKFESIRNQMHQFKDETSILAMILVVLDNQHHIGEENSHLSEEDFEEFLDVIFQEVLDSDEEGNAINQQIKERVMNIHHKNFVDFQSKLMEGGNDRTIVENIDMIDKNKKIMNYMRFSLRVQMFDQDTLVLLNGIIELVEMRIKDIMTSFDQFQGQNVVNQQNELQKLIKQKYNMIKEVSFLNQLTRRQTNLSQKLIDLIEQLSFKWFMEKTLNEIMLYGRAQLVNEQVKQSIRNIGKAQLNFLWDNHKLIPQLFNEHSIKGNSKNDANICSQKIVEIMSFLALELIPRSAQIQIKTIYNTPEQYNLFLVVSSHFLKALTPTSKQNQTLNSFIISLYLTSPQMALRQMIGQCSMIDKKDQQNFLIMFQKLMQNTIQCLPKEELVVILLKSLENFEYEFMCTYVEVLGILASYSNKVIEVLFETPSWEGYFNQKLTFELILKNKLIPHFSIEIKRRALFLLSNIAGSEVHYHLALSLITDLFNQNAIKQDFVSTEKFKEQLLIIESIVQTIMNYLSNIRSNEDMEELISIRRNNEPNLNNNDEDLLAWMVRILGSTVYNLCQKHQTTSDNERFIEILIYSLYNLLSISSSDQNNSGNKATVLFMVQKYQIPKHLELIYQNTQSTKSNFVGMLETLLDTIDKTKSDLEH